MASEQEKSNGQNDRSQVLEEQIDSMPIVEEDVAVSKHQNGSERHESNRTGVTKSNIPADDNTPQETSSESMPSSGIGSPSAGPGCKLLKSSSHFTRCIIYLSVRVHWLFVDARVWEKGKQTSELWKWFYDVPLGSLFCIFSQPCVSRWHHLHTPEYSRNICSSLPHTLYLFPDHADSCDSVKNGEKFVPQHWIRMKQRRRNDWFSRCWNCKTHWLVRITLFSSSQLFLCLSLFFIIVLFSKSCCEITSPPPSHMSYHLPTDVALFFLSRVKMYFSSSDVDVLPEKRSSACSVFRCMTFRFIFVSFFLHFSSPSCHSHLSFHQLLLFPFYLMPFSLIPDDLFGLICPLVNCLQIYLWEWIRWKRKIWSYDLKIKFWDSISRTWCQHQTCSSPRLPPNHHLLRNPLQRNDPAFKILFASPPVHQLKEEWLQWWDVIMMLNVCDFGRGFRGGKKKRSQNVMTKKNLYVHLWVHADRKEERKKFMSQESWGCEEQRMRIHSCSELHSDAHTYIQALVASSTTWFESPLVIHLLTSSHPSSCIPSRHPILLRFWFLVKLLSSLLHSMHGTLLRFGIFLERLEEELPLFFSTRKLGFVH